MQRLVNISFFAGRIACISLFSLALTGCHFNTSFKPPYNDFRPYTLSKTKKWVGGAALGAGVGAMAGVIAGNAGIGAVIGGVTGSFIGMQKNTRGALIAEIQNQDLQFIQYGNTFTLLVPTDRYFVFDTPRLNDICYPGLVNIINLIKSYPNCGPIYVAGFTDNVGSRHHKRMLSQARAEAMLTYLWANDIPAQLLHAEGYGDKHDIGNNRLIRGSAYNRRIEIQWTNARAVSVANYSGVMK